MTEFEVFRGPSDRLVAISVDPVRGEWVVRSGVQGSRLKVSTYPIEEYPSRDDVSSSLLTDRYVHEYVGRISPHGELLSVSQSSSLFWTASGVDVSAFSDALISLSEFCAEEGVDLPFTNDASGTYFSTDRSCFGVTTSNSRPGCVSTVNGKGSGEISFDDSSVLAAFAVYFSRLLHKPDKGAKFTLASNLDDELSTEKVLDRISNQLSSSESSLVERIGVRSLSLTLRKHGRARIAF